MLSQVEKGSNNEHKPNISLYGALKVYMTFNALITGPKNFNTDEFNNLYSLLADFLTIPPLRIESAQTTRVFESYMIPRSEDMTLYEANLLGEIFAESRAIVSSPKRHHVNLADIISGINYGVSSLIPDEFNFLVHSKEEFEDWTIQEQSDYLTKLLKTHDWVPIIDTTLEYICTTRDVFPQDPNSIYKDDDLLELEDPLYDFIESVCKHFLDLDPSVTFINKEANHVYSLIDRLFDLRAAIQART